MEVSDEVNVSATFDDLPDEIILHIISFADISSLSVLLGISKKFLVLTSSSMLPVLDNYNTRDISMNDIMIILSNSQYFVEVSLMNYTISKQILSTIEKKNSKDFPLKKLFINCSSLSSKLVKQTLSKKTLPHLKELGLCFGAELNDDVNFLIEEVLEPTNELENLFIRNYTTDLKKTKLDVFEKISKNLKEITLENVNWNTLDIFKFNFENLVRCFIHCGNDTINLKMFENSKKLNHLSIKGSGILKFNKSLFESLETFIFDKSTYPCSIFGEDIIQTFPKLKHLSLRMTDCQEFWKVIDQLKLESLSFKDCSITFMDDKDGLDAINHPSYLKLIEFVGVEKLETKDFLTLIYLSPSLENLIAKKCHFTSEYNRSFNFDPEETRLLKNLDFSGSKNFNFYNLKELIGQNRKTLKSLNLEKNMFLDNRFIHFKESKEMLESLEFLNLDSTMDDVDIILKLAIHFKVSTLRYLNITNCKANMDYLDAIFEMNPQISQFYAENSNVNDDHLKNFFKAPITSLNLSYTDVTEKGLGYLSKDNLSNLEFLKLFGITINDKEELYNVLSRCKHLNYLAINVKSIGVEDDLLKSLENSISLEDLAICGMGKCSKEEIEKFVLNHSLLKFMVMDDSPFIPEEVETLMKKCRKKGRRAPKLILCTLNSNLKKNMVFDSYDTRSKCIIS